MESNKKDVLSPFNGNPASNPAKRDWVKIVADSNGTRIFLPDQFKKRAEELARIQKEFSQMIDIMAEKEISFNMANQNILFDIRKYLAEIGKPTWTKEIGFDAEGLKDGVFVINLFEPQKRA